MARRKPDFAELVKDFELLGGSANGYEKADELQRALDERIEVLKTENGTLDEVCFNTR